MKNCHGNKVELPVIDETISSPSKRVLKNPDRRTIRAEYLNELHCSGEGLVDWCLDQVDEGTKGQFIDFNGNDIVLSTAIMDDLWGEDAGRTMNRYLQMANETPRQRAHERLVMREMVIDFAIQIHKKRCALAMRLSMEKQSQ